MWERREIRNKWKRGRTMMAEETEEEEQDEGGARMSSKGKEDKIKEEE